jgi:hypothetical protein
MEFVVRDELRGCYFCKGKPRSKEHILPDWLDRAMPAWNRSGISKHLHAEDGSVSHESKNFSRSVLRQKVKEPCKTCNNGWMSQLEDGVKATLIRLLAAHPSIFTRSEVSVLMRWAIKTHMMRAQLDEPGFPFPEADRVALMLGGLIPRSWNFWLGRTWLDGVRHNNWSMNVGIDGFGPFAFSQTTLSMGSFTLITSHVSDPDAQADFRAAVQDKIQGSSLPFIPLELPEVGVIWPPHEVADAASTVDLSNTMRQFVNDAFHWTKPPLPNIDFCDG